MYGLPIEGNRINYWGARAIYNPRWRPNGEGLLIEIVAEWSQYAPSPPQVVFVSWLQTHGIPNLKREIQKVPPAPTSQEVIRVNGLEGRFLIEATPRGSGGYLYIGAVYRDLPASVGCVECERRRRSDPTKTIKERCPMCGRSLSDVLGDLIRL